MSRGSDTQSARVAVDLERLSFIRRDPERRFGLPAGPHTQPGLALPLLAAGLLTGLFYGVLIPLDPQVWLRQSLMRDHAWLVSFFIVLLSSWALCILLVKRAKIGLQARALTLPVVPPEADWVLSGQTVDDVLKRLWDISDDPGRFMLLNRIHLALGNLRNMGRVGDLGDVLRYQAEADEAGVESSYGVVRGLIWAIPVLGFIGTVIGLSAAVGSFAEVLGEAESIEQITAELRGVTGGLAAAFETTLQALVAALVLQLLMVGVRRQEERMLDRFSDFCQRRIIGRVRLTQSVAAESADSVEDSPSAGAGGGGNGAGEAKAERSVRPCERSRGEVVA